MLFLVMSLSERFQWCDFESLSLIDKNLLDIEKFGRVCLLKIFECKENIDLEIDSILRKKEETIKELLDNLIATKKELFNKFFLSYCKSKKLLEYSGDVPVTLKQYINLEDVVRYNLWVVIFNEVSCEDIWRFFDNPLSYAGIYSFIDDFVSNFISSINDYICEALPELMNDDLFNDFLWYFKNEISKLIKLKICDNNQLNLDDLFCLISEEIYISISKDSLSNICHEFLENFHNYSIDSQSNENFDDTFECLRYLVEWTCIKMIDIESNMDQSLVDWEKIADDTWEFIREYLNNNGEFNISDYDEFLEKIYNIVLDSEKYELWKNLFLSRIKVPIKVNDIPIRSIDESIDLKHFIVALKERYPKAKNHIWILGFHKLKDKKIEYLEKCEENLKKSLSNLLDNDSIKKLNLVQLFKLMHYYLCILECNRLSIVNEFEWYLEKYFEQLFSESDFSVRKKEAEKEAKKIESHKLKQSVPVIEVKKPETEQIQNRELLSKELFEDIEFYFTNIDINHSKAEKSEIIKAIEKLPGKSYKRKWFKDFNLTDIFFQILDKNWYQCISEVKKVDGVRDILNVKSFSDWFVESFDSAVIDADDIYIKVSNLLDEINSIDDIETKIDLFIDSLNILYDFSNKELFKVLALNYVKSDVRILKWIVSVLERIIKWQKEELKTTKNRKKRYFTFDLWYNTWYRIVLQDQDWTTRKKIVDFVDHDTYMDRLPSYYKKY